MHTDERDVGTTALPARSQPLVAAAVTCGLVAMATWYVAAGGLRGGLVHHDAPPPVPAADYTVNVNAAGAAELGQLPGLGPVTAARIVEHRRTHGPFTRLEDLLDVPGVGPATFEQMRPHLRPIRIPDRAAAGNPR